MKYPTISVVIATYNSEKTLGKVLLSIEKQKYPKNKIETLIIDGGSTDSTLNIAKKFATKIINNPDVDFVHAKYLGYKKAKGKYILMLDSDEEIENPNSLNLKLNVMKSEKKVRVVMSSGYKSPSNYPEINSYINEYGDPFSLFMYRSSRDSEFFLEEFKKNYKVIKDNKNYTVFDFSGLKNAPFVELISMAAMIDLDYIKEKFPKMLKNFSLHNHLFYLINSNNNFMAITKNDAIIHYSVHSFRRYLKKISSRVKNNIFGTGMGVAGFSGREEFYSTRYKVKKFLFIPYSFSFLLPIADSIYFAYRHKKIIYLTHFILSIYTSILIIYFFSFKKLGLKTDLVGYAK